MKKGFTLNEILIVIALLGILSLITIPAFRNYRPSLQLGSTAREIVTDLRYIKQLTLTEQKEYCLKFFPEEKKYQLFECGETELLKEKVLPEEIKSLNVSGFTGNEVRYNPYGAVREAGTVILENTQNKTKTISVKASGFVTVND